MRDPSCRALSGYQLVWWMRHYFSGHIGPCSRREFTLKLKQMMVCLIKGRALAHILGVNVEAKPDRQCRRTEEYALWTRLLGNGYISYCSYSILCTSIQPIFPKHYKGYIMSRHWWNWNRRYSYKVDLEEKIFQKFLLLSKKFIITKKRIRRRQRH